MKMTFRWYGKDSDPINLKYVKQIPGMSGLMGLLDKPAGVDWPEEEVKELVDYVHSCGLELEVIDPKINLRVSKQTPDERYLLREPGSLHS